VLEAGSLIRQKSRAQAKTCCDRDSAKVHDAGRSIMAGLKPYPPTACKAPDGLDAKADPSLPSATSAAVFGMTTQRTGARNWHAVRNREQKTRVRISMFSGSRGWGATPERDDYCGENCRKWAY